MFKNDYERFALVPAKFLWPEGLLGDRFSHLAKDLVAELSRVGWDIPDIDVTVSHAGSGKALFRYVSYIQGVTEAGPFKLRLGIEWSRSSQQPVTMLSDAIIPPGLEVCHYIDSGPTLVKFLTMDWAKDGRHLMSRFHYNAALNREPRTYLRYEGRRGLFEPVQDSREYQPVGDEPKTISVGAVTDQVEVFIGSLVARLRALPTAAGAETRDENDMDPSMRRLLNINPTPVPEDFPVLFAWPDKYGSSHLADLVDNPIPREAFILSGSGVRLVSLGENCVVDRAHDGFAYAGTQWDKRAEHPIYQSDEDSLPVRIELKSLTEIYVVDMASYSRKTGTPEVAKTMIPAAEYVTGTFADPVYLIGRQLGPDEARYIAGKVQLKQSDHRIEVSVKDAETDREFVLFESDRLVPAVIDRAKFLVDRTRYKLAMIERASAMVADWQMDESAPAMTL